MGERQHSLPSPSISLCPTPSPALFSDSLYLFIFFICFAATLHSYKGQYSQFTPFPNPPPTPLSRRLVDSKCVCSEGLTTRADGFTPCSSPLPCRRPRRCSTCWPRVWSRPRPPLGSRPLRTPPRGPPGSRHWGSAQRNRDVKLASKHILLCWWSWMIQIKRHFLYNIIIIQTDSYEMCGAAKHTAVCKLPSLWPTLIISGGAPSYRQNPRMNARLRECEPLPEAPRVTKDHWGFKPEFIRIHLDKLQSEVRRSRYDVTDPIAIKKQEADAADGTEVNQVYLAFVRKSPILRESMR